MDFEGVGARESTFLASFPWLLVLWGVNHSLRGEGFRTVILSCGCPQGSHGEAYWEVGGGVQMGTDLNQNLDPEQKHIKKSARVQSDAPMVQTPGKPGSSPGGQLASSSGHVAL